MTTKIRILIFLLLICTTYHSQTGTFGITNSTGRSVRIYSTHYLNDSTKQASYLLLCKEIYGNPCSFISSSNLDYGNIRLDIIAIDDSTNETIFVKSYTKEQINSTNFVINIINSIDKLPPEIVTRPFLQIKAKDFKKIYKINDPIDLKLKDHQKIKGLIKSFDKETITLEGIDKKIRVIQRKEMVGLKSCGPIWAIGGGINFMHNCNYNDLEAIKFLIVKQVLVTKPDKTSSYQWKE